MARAGLALTLALSCAACGEDAAARRRRAEARILKRQIESLEEMVRATREKRLVDPSWLAVAVDETAVKAVIEAGLPQEAVVAGRFRVRVERAEVSFRSGGSLVSLKAHVTDERSRDRQAELVYQGGLDDITVSADGRFQTRVLIDNVEVPEAKAAGEDASTLASVAETLAGRNLEMLQGLIPALAIPVKLQQTLSIDGLRDGPIQVDPGTLPIRATVARVLCVSGRLWIFLDLKTGPWRAHPPATPSPAASGPSR